MRSDPCNLSLSPAIIEEALAGGFTSLWLPVELTQTQPGASQSLDFPTGSRFLTIGLCLSGSGLFSQSHRSWKVHPGQVWLAQPGIPWQFKDDPDQAWIGWRLACGGSRVPWFRTMLLKDDQDPVFAVNDVPPLLVLLEEIRQQLERGSTKRNLDCATLILGHFLSRLAQSRRSLRHRPPDSRERIAQTVEYLAQHLSAEIRISELAAMANLSESRYATLFRQQTGRSVLDHHNSCRMAKAEEMLRSGKLAIKDVAATLGYHDQLYFSRIFKKYRGIPPSEVRNTPAD